MASFGLSLGSLVLISLLLGVHLFGQVSLNPALHAQSASAYVPMKLALDASAPRLAKPLMQVSLVLALVTVAAAVVSGQVVASMSSAVALIALAGTLLAILRGDLPINRRMSTWNAEEPPADWQATRARWERFFAIRVATNGLALAAMVIAVVASAYEVG